MKKFLNSLSPTEKKVGAGVVLIALVGGGYAVYRGRKNRAVKRSINTFTKSTVTTTSGGAVMSVNVIETARQLGMDLGIAYHWSDPRSWTENDTAVYNILKSFPKELVPTLIKEYYTLYKRNLQEDVQRLLDKPLYDKIKFLFF